MFLSVFLTERTVSAARPSLTLFWCANMDNLAGVVRCALVECETNPRQICGYYPGIEIAWTICRKVNYSVCVCVGVRGDRPDLDFSKLCQLSMEERNNNAICWQNVHKNTQHSVKSAHLILLELQRGGKHSP